MKLIQIASLLNNTIIPNMFGGNSGVTIAEDLSNIADLGVLVSNLSADDLKDFQKRFVTGVVENWCESRRYDSETYGLFMDEIEYGGAVQRIRARILSAEDSPVLSLEDYNASSSAPDYNDGHFYGTALVSKVYTDTITKMVIHSVPLEMTRKSFTNARDVAKYDAMIEANVQNTITLELNGLAKGVFRKLAQACSSGRKIQLMTAYNTENGFTSTDPGYVDLTNWKRDTKFLLFCEEAVIRLKKAVTEMNIKYNDTTAECFTPPEDTRVLLLEEFATALDFAQSSVYHKELTDIGEYRTIQYWQNGSAALLPVITSQSVHDKIVIDGGTNPDVTIGPVVGFIYDRFTAGITERLIKTTSDYIAKADFVTYYNHVAYNNWINTANTSIMLVLE